MGNARWEGNPLTSHSPRPSGLLSHRAWSQHSDPYRTGLLTSPTPPNMYTFLVSREQLSGLCFQVSNCSSTGAGPGHSSTQRKAWCITLVQSPLHLGVAFLPLTAALVEGSLEKEVDRLGFSQRASHQVGRDRKYPLTLLALAARGHWSAKFLAGQQGLLPWDHL